MQARLDQLQVQLGTGKKSQTLADSATSGRWRSRSASGSRASRATSRTLDTVNLRLDMLDTVMARLDKVETEARGSAIVGRLWRRQHQPRQHADAVARAGSTSW